MLRVKYKLTLISVIEGCFWYPTSYEFINLNFTGIIRLKQKKTLPHSVYTTASANNFGTLLQFYCLLLQWILNWSKSYMYVPGECVNYITHSESVYKSQWKHTVNVPTHQVGLFKYRYCTHRILGYTLRYLGWKGRGHLQLHNKWQSEWSNCSLQTMILCSTLQHSTNHYCLNTTVETDKNTCLYIELIKTFPQTLIFRHLQTNTLFKLSNWILTCSVNNLQWINTGKSLKKPYLLNISQIQEQFHMIDGYEIWMTLFSKAGAGPWSWLLPPPQCEVKNESSLYH